MLSYLVTAKSEKFNSLDVKKLDEKFIKKLPGVSTVSKGVFTPDSPVD